MPKGSFRLGIGRAIEEAQMSSGEGGIPIGAVLIDEDIGVVGVGHNRRVQSDNPILHAEIDCLANAGRHLNYEKTILVSTLMPCYMCAGAIIQFGIPRVVAGESRNFKGAGGLLLEKGIDVIDLDDDRCQTLLQGFIFSHPDIWLEDIGTWHHASTY